MDYGTNYCLRNAMQNIYTQNYKIKDDKEKLYPRRHKFGEMFILINFYLEYNL